jgi:putative ABC transport system permease protein
MLRNYLTIALRNLRRNLGYTVINLIGLAVGLAACLLIGLYVRHELSYDDFHEKADRIQQVIFRSSGGSIDRIASTPRPLASTMQGQFPQVERLVRLKELTGVVRRGESSWTEDVLYADSGFFQMFSFPLVRGEPGGVLSSPNNVVLTAEKARQLFGTTDVVGRPLRVRLEGAFYDVTVAGIAESPPSTSSIQSGIVAPFQKYEQVTWTSRNTNWGSLDPLLYVELRRADQAEALTAQFPGFIEENVPQKEAKNVSLGLLPLPETHLTPGIYGQLEPTSRPLYAYILGGIAALILLIACVNFVTLSLGRAVGRAREVGVRKTVGAGRGQLMAQFWGEAVLLCGAALLLGGVVAGGALPVFNRLVGKELTAGMLLQPDMLLVLGGLLTVVGLAAGAYPAVALSRFEPAPVLRGRLPGGGASRLVQGLVVGQFVLAIGLVVGMGVMWRQMELLRSKDLGFQEEHVVQVDARPANAEQVRALRERFRQTARSVPSIQHVTALWGEVAVEGALPNRLATKSGGAEIEAHLLRGHYDLVDTFDLTLTQGRGFSPEYGRDAEGKTVLVNEALVEAFGWEEPLGKTLSVQFGVRKAEVVGVVEDFHFQTLRRSIEPLVIKMASRAPANRMYARIAPGQTTEALDRLRAVWTETVPALPFSTSFLDETIEQQYRADARWTRLVTWAAGLGVFIACMGLFGLATLAVRRRTKEVGVRKALGASAASIVRLLSVDFLKLVALAFVLAAPPAYWAARQWLQSFAYRVEVGAVVFVVAGGLTLAVALLAVGGQTLRAARIDPARTLRDE